MKRRRVKITGIGFVTPAGIGKEAFKKGILESVSRVVPVTRFDPAAGPFVAAEVKGFRVADYVGSSVSKQLPRHTQFALAGTKLALRDAGIGDDELRALSPLVVLGTSLIGHDLMNKTIGEVARGGPRRALARAVFQAPGGSIAGPVLEILGTGRALYLQTACCAGSDAIGNAANMVASGETDLAICGGTEAPIFDCPMYELKMAGLSPDTVDRAEQLCRPFDLWRTTGVIGEGACILTIEPETSPRPGYAFISGYAFSSDQLGDSCGGLHEAIRLCLANAGVRTREIDHISAWGPGHRKIDAAEAAALRRVFGNELGHIPAVSIKGSIANPLGAAGAIQIGCAALGIRDSFIPPTVNWRHPDPACPLNLSAQPRFLPIGTVLVDAHGLSGSNSCMVLKRCT